MDVGSGHGAAAPTLVAAATEASEQRKPNSDWANDMRRRRCKRRAELQCLTTLTESFEQKIGGTETFCAAQTTLQQPAAVARAFADGTKCEAPQRSRGPAAAAMDGCN